VSTGRQHRTPVAHHCRKRWVRILKCRHVLERPRGEERHDVGRGVSKGDRVVYEDTIGATALDQDPGPRMCRQAKGEPKPLGGWPVSRRPPNACRHRRSPDLPAVRALHSLRDTRTKSSTSAGRTSASRSPRLPVDPGGAAVESRRCTDQPTATHRPRRTIEAVRPRHLGLVLDGLRVTTTSLPGKPISTQRAAAWNLGRCGCLACRMRPR
jgi:hypothetical protein